MGKRSTRFTTTVPASELLNHIATIIKENPSMMMAQFPYRNMRQTTKITWESFKLEVFRNAVVICTVQIFLVRDRRAHSEQGLYMVEFMRFYEDIREKLSAVVKADYALQLLDAATSSK